MHQPGLACVHRRAPGSARVPCRRLLRPCRGRGPSRVAALVVVLPPHAARPPRAQLRPSAQRHGPAAPQRLAPPVPCLRACCAPLARCCHLSRAPTPMPQRLRAPSVYALSRSAYLAPREPATCPAPCPGSPSGRVVA